MIQDMSYHWDDPSVSSVNYGINLDSFSTAWGTFNDTAVLILSLPAGCLVATFNVSAAYRLTPIQPDQQQHLCVFWDGMIYVGQAVMFRLSSSAGVFGSIGDMLVAIYKNGSSNRLMISL